MSTAITTPERYARATHTSDLGIQPERRCDADVLLAAGIAASKDPRKALALAVYRIGVTGDHASIGPLVEELADWMSGHLARGGRRPMPRVQRVNLVNAVLGWWMAQTCGACNGLGYVQIDGAPVLSDHACQACDSTGKRPMLRALPDTRESTVQAARWLVAEIERLVTSIHSDMERMCCRSGSSCNVRERPNAHS